MGDSRMNHTVDIHNAIVLVERLGNKWPLLTAHADGWKVRLWFEDNDAFLAFVQDCNLMATAIQAERATEEAPVRRTCFGPQEVDHD